MQCGGSGLSYTNQQKRCPFPQSTAGALSKGKLRVSDPEGFDPCFVNLTALSQPAVGHHLMAGLFSTKACLKTIIIRKTKETISAASSKTECISTEIKSKQKNEIKHRSLALKITKTRTRNTSKAKIWHLP